METKNRNVWFITGASKGLGLALAKKLLEQGKKVAATSRDLQSLVKAVGEKSDNFLPLQMDLLNEENVKEIIKQTLDFFGSIDVVVNNAGYGQIGTLEELTDNEVRKNFDVNVFGVLNVIRNVIPYLRSQESGHIYNISSIGGYTGNFAGWGIYCSTKFALAGLSESLSAEVKSFGIDVSVVYPGYFRTNFLSEGSISLPENPLDEYKEARDSEALHKNNLDGNQMGDPDKAAEVMIKVSEDKNPPLHLFLGEDAFNAAQDKISIVKNDLEIWKDLTVSTAFSN